MLISANAIVFFLQPVYTLHMHTTLTRRLFLFASAATLAATAMVAHAQGAVTISIEQSGRLDILGKIVISQPNSDQIEITDDNFNSSSLPSGLYSVFIYPPAGTSVDTKFYLDGELQEQDGANITFRLDVGQQAAFDIEYLYTRTGNVGVSTNPAGIPFTLTGPDGLEWTGVSPDNYANVPEGQYTVQFNAPEGCGALRPIADRLIKGGRVFFSYEFQCEGAYKLLEQQQSSQPGSISGRIDGEIITFTDVPEGQWFTPFVTKAIKSGLLAGYTSSNGESTNEFGPNDNVNLAQLSKVAHSLAGISTQNIRGTVQNKKATNTWFEPFYISAEQKRWMLFTDIAQDPNRIATRGEVIGTLIQALGREPVWPRGDVFPDVFVHTRFAAAIEIAGQDGLVDTGKNFRPSDPINRAELAKIMVKALDLYGQEEEQ